MYNRLTLSAKNKAILNKNDYQLQRTRLKYSARNVKAQKCTNRHRDFLPHKLLRLDGKM